MKLYIWDPCQKPGKTQKGFWLVYTFDFRPPWSLTSALVANFDLLETACKSTWKILQNAEFTHAIQSLTPRMISWPNSTPHKYHKNLLCGLYVVPQPNNLNCWNAGSTGCKTQQKRWSNATTWSSQLLDKQSDLFLPQSPSTCFLAA